MDRRPRANPAAPPMDDGGRSRRIRAAVFELLSRRQRGEDVDVEQFQADYADLMPELAQAIAAGLRAYRGVVDAKRAWDDDAERGSVATAAGDHASPMPAIRHYRLRRELGAGGQGTVYEAVHEPTGRTVAVKVLTGVSKHAVARFEREAQTLARLSHPGLLSILDRGVTQGGAYYIAVEYVGGTDLDEWVARRPAGAAGGREVVALFAKLAAALGTAHAQGVVHRDLKPSNVRVDALGHPRVIDFGMARLAEAEVDRRLTVTRDVIGSVNWLSPEQAAGDVRSVSPASDVYALGVMLYHALVGTYPYPVDGTLMSTLRHICETAPVDPSRVAGGNGGGVDPALAGVLMRCLRKAPAERYADAGQLAADLEAWLVGRLKAPVAPRGARRLGRVVAAVAPAVLVLAWLVVPRGPDAAEVSEPLSLPTLTNSIGMELVELPTGAFRMGSPRDESGRRDDEQPHTVRITRKVLIGRTEVTRDQYLAVVGGLPAGVPAEPGDLPVDQVSVEEAEAFCRLLSERDGRAYRLPTEAEWEYACRAGTSGPFPVDAGHLPDVAWQRSNSGGTLHPVGTRRPNLWGLHDLHGNAAELTGDRYVPFLGTVERVDPAHRVGDASYVVRGGSAVDAPERCRSASRDSIQHKSRRIGVGFRVVCVPATQRL